MAKLSLRYVLRPVRPEASEVQVWVGASAASGSQSHKRLVRTWRANRYAGYCYAQPNTRFGPTSSFGGSKPGPDTVQSARQRRTNLRWSKTRPGDANNFDLKQDVMVPVPVT
jgi:hypothetical protein